jgi:hypothetical protein
VVSKWGRCLGPHAGPIGVSRAPVFPLHTPTPTFRVGVTLEGNHNAGEAAWPLEGPGPLSRSMRTLPGVPAPPQQGLGCEATTASALGAPRPLSRQLGADVTGAPSAAGGGGYGCAGARAPRISRCPGAPPAPCAGTRACRCAGAAHAMDRAREGSVSAGTWTRMARRGLENSAAVSFLTLFGGYLWQKLGAEWGKSW